MQWCAGGLVRLHLRRRKWSRITAAIGSANFCVRAAPAVWTRPLSPFPPHAPLGARHVCGHYGCSACQAASSSASRAAVIPAFIGASFRSCGTVAHQSSVPRTVSLIGR
jgi:hypothetical protein